MMLKLRQPAGNPTTAYGDKHHQLHRRPDSRSSPLRASPSGWLRSGGSAAEPGLGNAFGRRARSSTSIPWSRRRSGIDFDAGSTRDPQLRFGW